MLIAQFIGYVGFAIIGVYVLVIICISITYIVGLPGYSLDRAFKSKFGQDILFPVKFLLRKFGQRRS